MHSTIYCNKWSAVKVKFRKVILEKQKKQIKLVKEVVKLIQMVLKMMN